MSLGIVTEHLISLISKQVNDNGLVVWYDPGGVYADAHAFQDFPGATDSLDKFNGLG